MDPVLDKIDLGARVATLRHGQFFFGQDSDPRRPHSRSEGGNGKKEIRPTSKMIWWQFFPTFSHSLQVPTLFYL